ncbi:unnamed protein product [Adineta ricciae]|uniref:Uncharacterized protein n=1 Tax=Adineta ricciae TaxID=249248 RepID=A0A814W9F3_ADIRI|nr:unnamed protein product [Adineta ricciae]CAF1558861.1 unnamed protein product [Adineta ricciae]
MKMYVLLIYLVLSKIDAILVTKVHRSAIYTPSSACAALGNVTLSPMNASIQSCIWQCVHESQCQTAVYFHDYRNCSMFGEHCEAGNISSSTNIRASTICCRKNDESNMHCPSTMISTAMPITTNIPQTWITTGSMSFERKFHTATLLQNGTVLVIGGFDGSSSLKSVELYDPSTGNWAKAGDMNVARSSHTATILSNGMVLVTGGTYRNITELYNPFTGNWTVSGNVNVSRSSHTATMLSNGNVLVSGGWNSYSVSLNSAELYDSSTDSWKMIKNMNTRRCYHTASLLPNGTVLVIGGFDGNLCLNTAEYY